MNGHSSVSGLPPDAPAIPAESKNTAVSIDAQTNTTRKLDRGSRVRQLDILRGVAILMVLWCHAAVLHAPAGRFQSFAAMGDRFAWSGVDLFFVLSGFLIGGLLFREIRDTGRLHLFRFLWRRAFKIWPGYFALVAFGVAQRVAHGNSLATTLRHFLPYFFQVQNYSSVMSQGKWAMDLTWSLAVEEHFYLLLPVALLLLVLQGRDAVARLFLPFAVFAIGIIALYRTIYGTFSAYELTVHYMHTDLRIDALLAGVVCAHISIFHEATWARMMNAKGLFAIASVALIAPMTLIHRETLFGHTAGYTLLYLGFACLLIAIVAVVPGKGIAGKLVSSRVGQVVAAIGVYSYGIYLWHLNLAAYPVDHHLYLLSPRFPVTTVWLLAVAIYSALAVAVGVLMSTLIEKPALRLRERLSVRGQRRTPTRSNGLELSRASDPLGAEEAACGMM